jgi:hypothetical protein
LERGAPKQLNIEHNVWVCTLKQLRVLIVWTLQSVVLMVWITTSISSSSSGSHDLNLARVPKVLNTLDSVVSHIGSEWHTPKLDLVVTWTHKPLARLCLWGLASRLSGHLGITIVCLWCCLLFLFFFNSLLLLLLLH